MPLQIREYYDQVASVFSEAFETKEGWSLERDVRLELKSHSLKYDVCADIVIEKDSKPEIVVEISSRPSQVNIRVISSIMNALNVSVGFICTKNEIVWCSKDLPDAGIGHIDILTAKNLNKLYNDIKNKIDGIKQVTLDDFKNNWEDAIKAYYVDGDIKSKLLSFLSTICDNDLRNEGSPGYYCISEGKEDEFFGAILETYTGDKLCRNTSMKSIFRTLNDAEQSMCSIVCMNDPSETNYVLKYLGRIDLYDPEDVNGCYILSFVPEDKQKDFNMIRLYGDDAKGVSIIYDVVNNQADGFYLCKVSYAEGENKHAALNLVKRLLERKINGRYLKLNRLHIWSHFFKPHEYVGEQEVRLMFYKSITDTDVDKLNSSRIWTYDENFGIATPIVKFGMTDNKDYKFPLVLRQIIIGPKAKEAELNMEQLKCLLKTKNVKHSQVDDKLLVTCSDLKNYR